MFILPHNLALVKKIQSKITPYLNEAPILSSDELKNKIGAAAVHLKIESLQPSGSFKIRGTLAFLTSLKEGGYQGEVVTASDSNHARALALAAQLLGFNARIFLPQTTSESIVSELESLGARIETKGFSLSESSEIAKIFCREEDLQFVPNGGNPMTLAGIASSAQELLSYFALVERIGTIVLPIGSGGLAVGVAGLLKQERPNCYIVGVQSENICESPPTDKTGQLLDDIVDEVVTVSNQNIEKAISFLFHKHHLVAEHAGALAVAALLDDKVSIHARHVTAYVTGGNITAEQLTKNLSKDLIL